MTENENQRLSRKVAIVTGGSRGIGPVIVERLLNEGASLAFTHSSSEDAATALVNSLLRFDGSEPKARGVRAVLPHVDEFPPVHNRPALSDLAAALGATRSSTYDPRRYSEH
ncbi:NAD(P)-dependent dehydrogenase (short-subunit alcohol dehydrogenase family) [Rhizobium leguminosarum]|uniref:NAD(P)-dependent dehydrogenase (Short-subunit alcohol dehydrogenase family) n=1 Tax=Rhizobium leguminosarum TaxID=384 RepID=A0AAE2MLT5_RHILE|nr:MULTISPECIES: SDR family NAD(P)-dependent oxidoreductase [Rhizobium]MBB4291465.1 NAD(P)-dependent dehydrogenase (short-subunit alcohol dehydrogenase family) [Rhizobium leguminosarum]MBB4296162.1 NAD(P)-dependent dehydrogenase (short-subunit alcohol dehydrogenase family) [Rhizobium leguminosarum]MBB4308579.1 NAD(P)-dependent dehydrogenase (short-subunit alcohol dehydrogenase family) [Rhizobium leguminosarum]MBB4416414.1 NAD(P)-dependent dehydrogenase (short-subunit alcohol dehydrogenase famil